MAELKLALGAVADIASGAEIKDGIDKVLKSIDRGKRPYPKYFKKIGAGVSAASGDLVLDVGGPVVGEIWDVRALAVIQVDPWTVGTSTAPTTTNIVAASSGGAQANNVTLPGVAGATTFITGFEVSGLGATGSSTISITITGTASVNTPTYSYTVPAGAGVAAPTLLVEFSSPIPASGTNTAIVVNVPSFGAGNTTANVVAQGFQTTTLANSAVTKAGVFIGQGFAGFAANSNVAPTNELEDAGQSLPYTQHYVEGQLWVLYPNHLYVVIHNPVASTQYNAIARLVQFPSHPNEIA